MNSTPHTSSLLLVDDDRDLGTMLRDFFAEERLTLQIALSGEAGLDELSRGAFDLLILDIMLPGMSGLDVLKQVRRDSDVPVIMLTARGEDVDRIIGLEFGADDYLAKPFNPRELLARIKAILRRAQPGTPGASSYRLGELTLSTRTRTVTVLETQLTLTGTEFEILRCLIQSPGEVVSKERLCEIALGRRLLPYDRSIDTHISNLRGKLDKAGKHNTVIRNQRGVGYSLHPQS